jgi:4,5-DOPA dioxygenase extradiol
MSDSTSSGLTRRHLLGTAAAGLALARAGDALASPTPPAPPRRMPVAFVSHGSPMTAIDPAKGGEWQRWGQGWGSPKAILVVSAHWEAAPITLGAVRTVPLIYDFSGFPRELYAVKYAPPGAPELAQRVKGLLQPVTGQVRHALARGLDHGAWVPLVWLQRAGTTPVLQLSLPTESGPDLVKIGRALAPLRDEGVLILASGNLTHNLRRIDGRPNAATPGWAQEHDTWMAEALARRDVDALADYQRRAPALAMNHPTLEHLTPLFVAVGAAADGWTSARFPLTGFEGGSLSRRCVELA